jgi:ribose transport system substrate-binding protein
MGSGALAYPRDLPLTKGAIMPRRAYLAIAAVCLALAGCASGDSRSAAKYRIAVIPKGLTHEFWQSIHRGAERAGADLTAQGIPVEILWDGPSKENDAAEQIHLIEQKANMGIQGLVLAPQHSKQMVAPVEEVHTRIPVVIIDSGLDPAALKRDPNLIVKYIATNNYNGGWLAAERLLDLLAREGKKAPKLILFRYQPGSESTERREQGFIDCVEDRIARAKPGEAPQWLDKDTYALATVESAEKNATVLLSRLKDKHPDGLFTVNESSTAGVLNALHSLELEARPRFFGFDSSRQLLQALRSGEMDGLIVQDPYRMGYLGVWTMVQHLEGKDVSGGGKDYSTGEHVLTKDNMDTEEMKGLFDSAAQQKRSVVLPDFSPKK